MRTHVSFEADTGNIADVTPPRGRELLDELLAALRARGLEVDAPQAIDYAFEFWIRCEGNKYYGMFGEVDDGVRQWLMSAEAAGFSLQRLFGRDRDKAHRSILTALHNALSDSPRVRSIRWYERDDWNAAPDERWHPAPTA